jgi:hypothetical protein
VGVTRHRTLRAVLEELKLQGYRLVAVEQTTNSVSLTRYEFRARTALVVGNERRGLRCSPARAGRRRRRGSALRTAAQSERRDRDSDGAL